MQMALSWLVNYYVMCFLSKMYGYLIYMICMWIIRLSKVSKNLWLVIYMFIFFVLTKRYCNSHDNNLYDVKFHNIMWHRLFYVMAWWLWGCAYFTFISPNFLSSDSLRVHLLFPKILCCIPCPVCCLGLSWVGRVPLQAWFAFCTIIWGPIP